MQTVRVQMVSDQIKEEPFDLPIDKPLTLDSYSAGTEKVAYIEIVGFGDPLPDKPIFLIPDNDVLCLLVRVPK